MHLADADFLAPVLRLEYHEPEHADQREDNRQQAEHGDEAPQVLLLVIQLVEDLVVELDVERIRGIEIAHHRADMRHRGGDVGPRLQADVGDGHRIIIADNETNLVLPAAQGGDLQVVRETDDPTRRVRLQPLARPHIQRLAGGTVEDVGILARTFVRLREVAPLHHGDA